MKLQQMIELVQQHHSVMGEKEIVLGLNRAKDDFCTKTELIKDTFTQNSSAGQRYYSLDEKILKILDVQANDVSIPRILQKPLIDDDEFDTPTNPLATPTVTSKDRYWYIDNDRLGVVEKGLVTRDEKTTEFQTISETGIELRIHCIAKEADYATDLTISSRLPSQYHDALIYKVLSEGYLKGGTTGFDPQLSQLFEQKYLTLVKDAKKEARKNYSSSFGQVKPQEF